MGPVFDRRIEITGEFLPLVSEGNQLPIDCSELDQEALPVTRFVGLHQAGQPFLQLLRKCDVLRRTEGFEEASKDPQGPLEQAIAPTYGVPSTRGIGERSPSPRDPSARPRAAYIW